MEVWSVLPGNSARNGKAGLLSERVGPGSDHAGGCLHTFGVFSQRGERKCSPNASWCTRPRLISILWCLCVRLCVLRAIRRGGGYHLQPGAVPHNLGGSEAFAPDLPADPQDGRSRKSASSGREEARTSDHSLTHGTLCTARHRARGWWVGGWSLVCVSSI